MPVLILNLVSSRQLRSHMPHLVRVQPCPLEALTGCALHTSQAGVSNLQLWQLLAFHSQHLHKPHTSSMSTAAPAVCMHCGACCVQGSHGSSSSSKNAFPIPTDVVTSVLEHLDQQQRLSTCAVVSRSWNSAAVAANSRVTVRLRSRATQQQLSHGCANMATISPAWWSETTT